MRPHIRRRISDLASVFGVVGYVGMLVAGHYLPRAATGLQIAAFVWLFGCGAVKLWLFYTARRKSGRQIRSGPTARP